MTFQRPLFVFGIARSGTNLIARMLDAHPRVAVALDPLLPLLKAARNATVAADAPTDLAVRFDPQCPFLDYYGLADGPTLLDLMLGANLSMPVPPDELPALRAAVATRAGFESCVLPSALQDLSGSSFRDLIARALAIVAKVQGGSDLDYAGVKEVWTIDFLPALARAFPNARFLVIERDPRAILASLKALAEREPDQQAHALSYLRHWRKTVVLARHFAADPALAPRLKRVRYERLATEPQAEAEAICQFLELETDPAMLRLEDAKDYLTGGRWRGNSSYRTESGRITSTSVEHWRSILTAEDVAAINWLCEPELRLAGYGEAPADGADAAALALLMDSDQCAGSWRSDAGGIIKNWGVETLRRTLLDPVAPRQPQLARQCFLFDWCLDAARDVASSSFPACLTASGRPSADP